MAFNTRIPVVGDPIDEDSQMPFGKYKDTGIKIKDIPKSYLLWAVEKADFCNPDHPRYWEDLHKIFYKVLYGKDLDANPPFQGAPPPLPTTPPPPNHSAWTAVSQKANGRVTWNLPDPNTMLSFPAFCRVLENINVQIKIVDKDGTKDVEPSMRLAPKFQDCLEAYKHEFIAAARCLVAQEPQKRQETSSVPQSKRILITGEIRAIVKKWYRKMSGQHHPDRGGSIISQSAVNACYASFMELLEEWESKKDE